MDVDPGEPESELKITQPEEKNILVLGTTGVGKSSFCFNLGATDAVSSDKPIGETLDFMKLKPLLRNGVIFHITDACGFNEGKDGAVIRDQAIKKFITFVGAHQSGFNLVILVKPLRNDENLDKNFKLIRSLLPEVPILLCVQQTYSGWDKKACDCKVFKRPHTYDHHAPQGIAGFLCVDLPGADYVQTKKDRNRWTADNQADLEADIKRAWQFIEAESKIKYPMTPGGYFNGFLELLNWIGVKIGAGILFITESLKKVADVLVENGMKKDEAQKMVKDLAAQLQKE